MEDWEIKEHDAATWLSRGSKRENAKNRDRMIKQMRQNVEFCESW